MPLRIGGAITAVSIELVRGFFKDRRTGFLSALEVRIDVVHNNVSDKV